MSHWKAYCLLVTTTGSPLQSCRGGEKEPGAKLEPYSTFTREGAHRMRPTILALDLEVTLFSNAVSQIPRPGLLAFLHRAQKTFDEVVLFTTLPRHSALRIASLLVEEECVPRWFAAIPYMEWDGSTEDLRFMVPQPGQALLLDDHCPCVLLNQLELWVEAPLFASPYPANDCGLQISQSRIVERVSMLSRSPR